MEVNQHFLQRSTRVSAYESFPVHFAIEQISVRKFMTCASFITWLQGFPKAQCSSEMDSAVCTRELQLLGFDPQASGKSLVKKKQWINFLYKSLYVYTEVSSYQ